MFSLCFSVGKLLEIDFGSYSCGDGVILSFSIRRGFFFLNEILGEPLLISSGSGIVLKPAIDAALH